VRQRGAEPLADPHQGRESGRRGGHGSRDRRIEAVVKDDGILRREVPEERHVTDAGLPGDLLDGGRVVPLLGEQPECRLL